MAGQFPSLSPNKLFRPHLGLQGERDKIHTGVYTTGGAGTGFTNGKI